MSFENYIKDKKVIFVGACPNLRGTGQGEFIDSHDIVVRSNGSIELIEDPQFRKDYGERCDALYINNQYHRYLKNNGGVPLTEYKSKGVKFLCFKNASKTDRDRYGTEIPARRIKDIILEVVKKVPSATMGTFLIHDILRYEPEELFITGVDFFASRYKEHRSRTYREYVPGYLPDMIIEEAEPLNKDKKEDAHNFYENAKIVYDLMQGPSTIKMPDFIYSLLAGIVNEGVVQE